LILLASPMVTVRRRWKRGLEGSFVALEIADRAALKRQIAHLKPSVLLLDLSLPKLGGLDGVGEIARLSPSTKILALSSHPDDHEATAALKSGAFGYCDRETDPMHVRKAVETLQKGEVWVNRRVIPLLLNEIIPAGRSTQNRPSSTTPGGPLSPLTRREHMVAEQIGSGANNRQIASWLDVTEATVKAHLTSIFRKVGVSNRLRLALLVNRRSNPSPQRRVPHSSESATANAG
jgi:DNA-binding NarL/FixJ family response regulator